MELKDRVKKARESKIGMTQEKLADLAGISRTAVVMWESGETKSLAAEPCIRAARAMNVDELWLASGEGQMYDHSVKETAAGYATIPQELIRAWQALDKNMREHLLVIATTLADKKK